MSFSADKFVKRMFRRIDGIVWDAMTGATGLKTPEGIFTMTTDAEGNSSVTVNPFDMSMALPGFATQTPHDQVNVGDIIVGDKQILGWVTEKKPASFVLLDVNGMTKQYSPPKVAIMGGSGPLVVRNLFSLTGGQGVTEMLPMLMMLGGDDSKLEKILPFLLMQSSAPAAAGGAAAAANPMAAMLPFLLMKGGLGGGRGGDIDPMMLMAMSGGMGGAGGMNPMMLMALSGGFGGDDAPSLGASRPNSPPPLSQLSRF